MKVFTLFFCLLVCLSCNDISKTQPPISLLETEVKDSDYVMVFASCNDQERPQPLWGPILENQPDLFVWGGDNIYADTGDMIKMKADYDKVWSNAGYAKLANSTIITGVWDDHDFGKNDAGADWEMKEDAKNVFLDFLKVPEEDVRRTREGTYKMEIYKTQKGSIKLLLLDTRTFRDSLHKSKDPNKRYDGWPKGEGGTILGEQQWSWLENELNKNDTNFTVIVTSIQFLSNEHGYEKWANFPDEIERMNKVLKKAKANNILMLSGDRHQAEVSLSNELELGYPLVDFTSSGLTHTWIDGASFKNSYRISNVVKRLNFGVLRFNFEKQQLLIEVRGEDNFLYEQFEIQY